VRGLYARLTQDGVDAWLDKAKLLPGQDWELEIRKAVREADVVVVCLSKQFNQAGFRQKEVRLALDTAMEKPEGEIFIIPARLEECDTLESLRKWHWVDLFEDNGYEMLMRTLRARADRIDLKIPSKQELRIFYDLSCHYEQDIENASAEVITKYLIESLTRIMSFVSIYDKNNASLTLEFLIDHIEYFDPKEGKTLQYAIIIHGKKQELLGNSQFKPVQSIADIQDMLIITITQGVSKVKIRFDSNNLPSEVFDIFIKSILEDLVGFAPAKPL
jgi:hypothetical protein